MELFIVFVVGYLIVGVTAGSWALHKRGQSRRGEEDALFMVAFWPAVVLLIVLKKVSKIWGWFE